MLFISSKKITDSNFEEISIKELKEFCNSKYVFSKASSSSFDNKSLFFSKIFSALKKVKVSKFDLELRFLSVSKNKSTLL